MRVLTATSATQGDRPDDICWTTTGELVSLPLLECSCPDCGCDRSFAGLDSHRATTTCAVTDEPLDLVGLRRAVTRSLAVAGWLVDVDLDRAAAVDPEADLDPDAGPDPDAVVDTWADLHRLVEPPDIDGLSALDRELVDDVVARIVDVAQAFAPGTVLGRAEGGVVVRRPAPAPAADAGVSG